MATALSIRYRPKSFFTLVLFGFCLVTLPMAFGLINGAVYVDRLFVQSEFAVYRAAQASQVSRSLIGQISDMERNARQYQVLADDTLLTNYRERHLQFQETAQNLGTLADSPLLKQYLEKLHAQEEALFRFVLHKEKPSEMDAYQSEAAFIELNRLGQSIVQEAQLWINSQVASLSEMANKTETLLVWQTAALVTGTLVFAVILSVMISRPIRQIDSAIRRLGDGEFDSEIRVKGPKDLQYLGERLDWLRHRLVELEEKKGNFIRHVSHELKTPLTAMREGSALLAEGVLGHLTQQQREVTQVLQRNCILLQKMIENLLNFNMVQAKRTILDVGDVRLDEIIKDVAADHKFALLAKKIRLTMDCPRVHIKGDREKLRIVVDNLLSNGIKYSPDGGTLNVTLQRDRDHAVLDVQDSGPGVDPSEHEKVFEAFYRGKLTPNSDIRGSGLGLSIVKEFVSIHQGRIEVVPEAEKGAHFRVTLPFGLDRDMA